TEEVGGELPARLAPPPRNIDFLRITRIANLVFSADALIASSRQYPFLSCPGALADVCRPIIRSSRRPHVDRTHCARDDKNEEDLISQDDGLTMAASAQSSASDSGSSQPCASTRRFSARSPAMITAREWP